MAELQQLCKLILTFTEKAKRFQANGDKFRENGDLAGSLTNYLLAFNSYDSAINIFTQIGSAEREKEWCQETLLGLQNKKNNIKKDIPYLPRELPKKL